MDEEHDAESEPRPASDRAEEGVVVVVVSVAGFDLVVKAVGEDAKYWAESVAGCCAE